MVVRAVNNRFTNYLTVSFRWNGTVNEIIFNNVIRTEWNAEQLKISLS
jgi:hypothetical protein